MHHPFRVNKVKKNCDNIFSSVVQFLCFNILLLLYFSKVLDWISVLARLIGLIMLFRSYQAVDSIKIIIQDPFQNQNPFMKRQRSVQPLDNGIFIKSLKQYDTIKPQKQ